MRFLNPDEKPQQRLEKPETGRYDLVRLIRSDLKFNILGELFSVAPELKLGRWWRLSMAQNRS
ncbi:hypothetical protein ICT70_12970 [Pelobacter sp. M08fum]|uniref:Uncharacterized protein n=1 Tax=Pelovirga terrestris TaxID=2771352 RepID=A0A8J6QPA6_9BACT|nr:hypothetical protein [Pelovirga terrestris]